MIALVLIGKMVKTLLLPQIGMKALNTLIMDLMVLTQAMAVVLKEIKANSLNLFLVEANTVKAVAADKHAKA